jgi:hypothetical protein
MVDLARGADLLDVARVHHHHPIGERHRFHLVVGDEDRGGGKPAVQAANLDAHLHAQLGIEVGERLVEQEDLRLADHGARHGHALALAAGELGGLAVEEAGEAHRLRHGGHA